MWVGRTTMARQTKADECDYQCDDCMRPFHTKKGLEHHRERIHN